MHQELTILQQAVVRRLRAAACPEIAQGALESWSRGEKASSGTQRMDAGRNEVVPFELRADFARADEQATRPSSS
jgi:hypothetical protein